MKNTRKNVIELLKEMSKNTWDVAQHFKSIGDKAYYDALIHELNGYDTAIRLLENPEFFNKMCEIHNERK